MDILYPLPKTKSGNQLVFVLTDRYKKLTRAIPVTTVTSTCATTVFVDNWNIPHDILTYLMTEKGLQFVSKFFAAVTARLGTRHLMTTAYRPQTNGQVERFNRTVVARLRHFVTEHQTNWDQYVQLLTHEYNDQVHRPTGTTPFSFVLSRQTPGPITANPASAIFLMA